MSDEEHDSVGDASEPDGDDDRVEDAPDEPEDEDEEVKGPSAFSSAQDDISKAAGLLYPVRGLKRCLEFALETRDSWPRRVETATAVGLAAVLEYMTAEVVELAGNAARDNRKTNVIPRHVNLAMWNDEELQKSFIIRGNYEHVPEKKRPQLVFYPPALRSIVVKRRTAQPWKLPLSTDTVVEATVLDAFSAHADTQSVVMTFESQPGPKKSRPKLVLKTPNPERQYTIENDDPPLIDMTRLKFHNRLRQVLKQVHPDCGIRPLAVDYVNAILHHWLSRLEARAFLAAQKVAAQVGTQCQTLTPEHLVTAIGECLPGELTKHAMSEMKKALTKAQTVLAKENQQ